MKILVVGNGGREHAIIHKLLESKNVSKIYCASGNGGISDEAELVPIKPTDIPALVSFALRKEIDYTVVGMDDPLVLGIVDAFESVGLKAFGPMQKAAMIEGSKSFAKNLMKKYGIPTAGYEVFSDYEKAVQYVKLQEMPIVIKADGLALGKGVLICNTLDEAISALKLIMLYKKFGDAGKSVVIEEFLTGPEVSVLSFCDGETVVPMVSAQDHKRAFDNDKGLNTGGMGTFSPSRIYTPEIAEECMKSIFIPTVKAMEKEGRPFKGVLYFGLMLTKDGMKVIEYNARFGDPETQVVLPRLKTDLLDIMLACTNGMLDKLSIEWYDNAAVCVVLASGGYPESYEKGFVISGIDKANEVDGIKVYHAGTALKDGNFVTNGGRVLGVTGVDENLDLAIKKAYEGVSKISFKDMHFRHDIGIKKY
ncbi:MAG: phosphoribosylamine--glycine ligase [Lachnospiraceae bacterium]|nr:phosphoribosylamine--glycine ligase [Lachnospiraceae bacterium]